MMKEKRTWAAGKPKKKPDYDPVAISKEIMDSVAKLYEKKDRNGRRPSLQAIVDYYQAAGCGGMNPIKVRKLLITAGVYESAIAEQVKSLLNEGRTPQEIMDILKLSRSSVHSYLPYQRILYRLDESGAQRSVGADREQLFRNRKKVVKQLSKHPDEQHLWEAIVLFAGYPFVTQNGEKFTYTVNNNDLFLNVSENPVMWETIIGIYRRVLQSSCMVLDDEKEQRINGEPVSYYLYCIFRRLGILA